MTKAGLDTHMVFFSIGDELWFPSQKIIREFYYSHFTMHPGGTKMYHDLRRQYYWSGRKKHVGDFVRQCLMC